MQLLAYFTFSKYTLITINNSDFNFIDSGNSNTNNNNISLSINKADNNNDSNEVVPDIKLLGSAN